MRNIASPTLKSEIATAFGVGSVLSAACPRLIGGFVRSLPKDLAAHGVADWNRKKGPNRTAHLALSHLIAHKKYIFLSHNARVPGCLPLKMVRKSHI
jgi:hypothetical protein